jgi:Domain of unknown function (DUF4258)
VNETLRRVSDLVKAGKVRLTEHALTRLIKHELKYRDILAGLADAVVIEAYPEYVHGPAVLVLQEDRHGEPVHVLWGLPASGVDIAFVVTVYRPDDRWSPDKLVRRPR